MASVIHQLAAIITTNPDKFVRGIDRAILKTKQFGRAWATVGKGIATAASRITIAVTAMSALSIKRFAQLERTMARVQGVTGTAGKAFDKLNAAALKMGATTEFTANQAAEAMEQLGLAGFKTNAIIAALPGTLQLATAAQIDIATASNIAAKTMKAFGFEAKDLGRINDTLVATFTRSNTNILQLAEALKPVGPVARAVGVSLEDTAAILAKMADAGFQGSLGGTALRNAFIRLASPSSKAKKILQELGVNAIDPLFVKLKKITKGMNEAANENEKLAIAAELFGVRGGPAMLAALAAGVDSIQKFSKGLKDAGGIADRLQKIQLKTLSGQFNLLKSAMDAVLITTGKKLAPAFRELVNQIKAWLDLNADEIAEKLSQAMLQLAEFAKVAVQGLIELGPAFLEVMVATRQFLQPILEFMLLHPQLMGMLLALKITGLLGLIPAVVSLTTALFSLNAVILTGLIPSMGTLITVTIPQLIGAFAAMWTSTGALTGKMLALSVAVKALTIIGLAVFFSQIAISMGLVGEKAKDLNIQIAETNRLVREGLKLTQKQINVAGGDPRSTPQLQDVRRQLVQRRGGAIRRQSRQQGLADKAFRPGEQIVDKIGTVGGFFGKTAQEIERDAAQANATAAKAEANAIQKQIDQIDKLIKARKAEAQQSRKAIADKKQAAQVRKNDEAARRRGGRQPITAAQKEAAGKRAKGLDAAEGIVGGAELQGLEERFPGLGQARTVAAKGTGLQLQRLFGTMGAGPQRARELATGVSGKRGDERESALRSALASIKAMNEARQKEKETIEAATQLLDDNNDSLDEFEQNMLDLHRAHEIGSDDASKLNVRIRELREQLNRGAIDSEDFARALKNLNLEQQEAIRAAKEKEIQEKRQRMLRLLRGRGTEEDVQFLRDQQRAARLARFDSQLGQLFNNTFGLNRTVQRMNTTFRDVGRRVSGFGRRISGAASQVGGGGGDGGGASQRFTRFASFMNSTAGQIQLMQNNVNLLQQNLRVVDTGRRQQQILRQIRQLMSNIAALRRNAPPPAFIGFSGDGPFFADPGLVGGAGRQAGAMGVNITMNVSEPLTAGDAAHLLDRMNLEIQRTGTPRVF